jgi:hypothetical protein
VCGGNCGKVQISSAKNRNKGANGEQQKKKLSRKLKVVIVQSPFKMKKGEVPGLLRTSFKNAAQQKKNVAQEIPKWCAAKKKWCAPIFKETNGMVQKVFFRKFSC